MSAAPADRPYHHLDGIARELWRWSVVCSGGTAEARLAQAQPWHDALLAGRLPDAAHDFGDPDAVRPLRTLLTELDLLTLTQGSTSITRQMLQSLLWHLDSLIERPATETRAQAIARMAAEFRENWTLQRQGWEEALSLLKSLGDHAHLHWDDLKGQLSRREWTEARRIGGLLERLPALAQFIDGVGRRQLAAHQPLARTVRPETQAPERAAPQPTDDDERHPEPTAVDGVHRSRTLARMTGSESLNLTHPVLRRLWRARFAEAQLLTYDDRARTPRPNPRPRPDGAAARVHDAPLGLGPLIVCLDTSGSMQGAPENVAKACVLQALRSAHAGDRACQLLAFGGPGELLERPLTRTAAGLDALLDLMGQAFDGGTDVQTPIERAVEQVQQQGWQDADVLIVSDGEFGLTPATLAQLRQAKERLGLRVHGILIGDRETIGLVEICDALHWVRDWRRYGQAGGAAAEGFSPVHSRSLTAMYFPNAIRR
ncbi:vWA domain-containing protein [Hydrogenophaga sp.]|uniref:vWA domain-containing protein n=1 Tax=Hydrogenophaga sp. TaxID=1904254 RepID=UPI00286E7892|nr:VWA domain-containing protein [Hydrogenophaga sp.]